MNNTPVHDREPDEEEMERQLARLLAGMEEDPSRTPPLPTSLPPDAQQRLHRAGACLRLLQKARSGIHALPTPGDTPRVASTEPSQHVDDALLQCIMQELQLRQAVGASLVLQDYLDRYPQYAVQIHGALATPRESLGGQQTPRDGLAPGEGQRFKTLPGLSVGELPRLQLPDYQLLQEIGRGGMGVVYKAWQLGLKRVVALKMILAGEFASPEMRQRFRAEAEAVASLQHPNVVQIHEIGELDGNAYFAMEYVDGPSLSGFLGGQPQPPREAARLLLILALAMHAAHQRGIVHRDLKPANVLLAPWSQGRLERSSGRYPALGAEPQLSHFQPKITDFGLAKRLDQDQHLTGTGQAVGTPCYMAPEQANNQAQIGPATDVYALGAILYELLTGRPPFRAPTPVETIMLMLNTETVPPRRLQAKVPVDLETICLKCLAKEPSRRYASAAELAEDVQRFLSGKTIKARPVSFWERTWKEAKRRPALTALLAVSIVAVATLLTLWVQFTRQVQDALGQVEKALEISRENEAQATQQQKIAQEERQRADENLEQSLTAVDQMLAHVGADRLAQFPQMAPIRKQLLEDALKLQEGLLQRQSAHRSTRFETARTVHRVGDINALLGRVAAAEKAYRQAMDLLQALETESPQVRKYPQERARSTLRLGVLLCTHGKIAQGEKCYTDILPVVERLRREDPKDDTPLQQQAVIYSSLGAIAKNRGRENDAVAWYEKGTAPFEELARKHPKDPKQQANLAQHLGSYGGLCVTRGEFAQGEQLIRRAVSILEEVVRQHPTDIVFQRMLAARVMLLGEYLLYTERLADAEPAFRQVLALYERQARDHPTVRDFQADLARTVRRLGHLLEDRDKWHAAQQLHQRSLTLCENLVRQDPTNVNEAEQLGITLTRLAHCAAVRDHHEQALTYAERAVATLLKLRDRRQGRSDFANNLAQAYWELARTYESLGRHREALQAWDQLAPLLKAIGQDHRAAQRQDDLRIARALTLASLGEHAQAMAQAQVSSQELARTPMLAFFRARALSQAARAAIKDARLQPEQRQTAADAYLAEALHTLREADKQGLFRKRPLAVQELMIKEQFELLRHRADFRAFILPVQARLWVVGLTSGGIGGASVGGGPAALPGR